jgi:hypothetical protein
METETAGIAEKPLEPEVVAALAESHRAGRLLAAAVDLALVFHRVSPGSVRAPCALRRGKRGSRSAITPGAAIGGARKPFVVHGDASP